VALERLTQDISGELLYRFTRACSDGTTGIKLSPLELIEKLAALVPPPIAPARLCQATFAFDEATAGVGL
jgi:hypothetical protein